MVQTWTLTAAMIASSLAPRAVEKIDYLGWKDCCKLTNAQAEVIVVPPMGRAVSFRRLDGKNVFLFYPELGGETRRVTEPYINFGGLYTWLAPELHWSLTEPQKQANLPFCPPLDGLPCEVKSVGKRRVTLARQDRGQYNLTMEKTYALDETAAKLVYTVTIINCSDIPIRWAIWNLVGTKPLGKLLFLAPGGWDDFHFVFNVAGSPELFRRHTRFVDSLAVIDFDAIQAVRKNAYVKPGSWFVAQYTPDAWLVRSFAKPAAGDLFTDNHSQIEIWCDGPFFEVEVLSPEVKLEPNEAYSWREEFTIHSAKDVPWPEDLSKLKETIHQLVPEMPTPPK